jgi:mannose/cellobiose epimerase-like protein (N-acyl-D-glucosamine 2-epimerase family)
MRMLMQGAVSLAARQALAPAARQQVFDCAAEFAGDVLHRHWDAATGVFAENIDRRTGARQELLDPGHAIEFAGLGLSAARSMQADPAAAARHAGLLAEARREMPRILTSAFATGWNRRHPGLLKKAHNRTAAPIIDQMPWWNLPETMRAAAYAAAGAAGEVEKKRYHAILIRCHNAYFTQYPNRNYFLFPYQTLDGATGRVLDVAPAVPEGDPLYHANLSLLEMLDVLSGGSSAGIR